MFRFRMCKLWTIMVNYKFKRWQRHQKQEIRNRTCQTLLHVPHQQSVRSPPPHVHIDVVVQVIMRSSCAHVFRTGVLVATLRVKILNEGMWCFATWHDTTHVTTCSHARSLVFMPWFVSRCSFWFCFWYCSVLISYHETTVRSCWG
jgi:hypothetical protein